MPIRRACTALALAVAFAPMPAVAEPISGFLASVAAGGALGGGLLGGLLGRVLVSVGLGLLARVFAPKQQAPSPAERMVNFAQPVAFMERGYGRVRKGGPVAFTGFRDKTRHYGILIASHSTKGPVEHWLDKRPVEIDAAGNVTTEPIAGAGTIRAHTGQAGQAADPVWQAAFPEITASHDFAGLSYAALGARRVTDAKFQDIYPRGREWEYLPVWDMADFVFDPRDGLNKWTDNAALIIASEALFFGKTVDWTEVAAEADVCDELVTNAEGNPQKRWTTNGVFDDSMSWEQVRDALAVACDAFFYERPDGALGFKVGRWIAPTITLTARDILAISVAEASWGPDAAGEFAIRYVEPARDWVEAPSGAWIEDSGAPRDEREAFLIDSHNQAARIAKRIGRIARARYTIEMRVRLIGYELIGQRFVHITHPEMGLDLDVEIGRITRAADGLSFEIEAASVAAEDFAFVAASEEPDRPTFTEVPGEDDVEAPGSLAGQVVDDTGGAAAIEWTWPVQDASLRQELRLRVVGTAQLSPAAALSFAPSALITDAAFGGTTRSADATFRAVVVLPATPTEGTLMERGGVGQAMWIGLRNGGAALRYRVGSGKAASVSDTEVMMINLATSTLPFDGLEHTLEWDVRLSAPARIRFWIDGVLEGSAQLAGGGPLWGWSGAGVGAYGHLAVSDVTGEPSGGWPVTVTNDLLFWPGLLEDLSQSDWQHVLAGAGQTSFFATGLIDGATWQGQVRNRTAGGRVSDWAPAQPIAVQAIANTTPPGALGVFGAQAIGSDVEITLRTPNDGAYFATRIYRAASGAGFGAATLLHTEFGAPGSSDDWTDVGPGTGTWDYWGEPINASGLAGPVSGPATVSVP